MTHATPVNAIIEPIIVPLPGFSFLYIIHINRVVISGEVVTSNDTLVTNVYSRAMFSAMKYIDPAHNPHTINKNSSLIELDKMRL